MRGSTAARMPVDRASPAGLMQLAADVGPAPMHAGERKTAARGASAVLLGPAFRLLAPAGLLRRLFNRQWLVHTFATSLRGPAEPLRFAGAPVRAVIPTPEHDRQRHRHLRRAVLRRDAADRDRV